jgi:hypothetical protein
VITIQAIEHRDAGGRGLVQIDRPSWSLSSRCKVAALRTGAADSAAPGKAAQKEIT